MGLLSARCLPGRDVQARADRGGAAASPVLAAASLREMHNPRSSPTTSDPGVGHLLESPTWQLILIPTDDPDLFAGYVTGTGGVPWTATQWGYFLRAWHPAPQARRLGGGERI